MEPVIVGAVVGALIAWVLAALFSSGPRSAGEFLSGDYASSGVGCVGWLLMLAVGAAVGAGGAMWLASG